MLGLLLCSVLISARATLPSVATEMATDYFTYKNIKYLCYISCGSNHDNKRTVEYMISHNIRASVARAEAGVNLARALHQHLAPTGVLVDASCEGTQHILDAASRSMLLDAAHCWLVLVGPKINTTLFIDAAFGNLNLSIDADLVVASYEDDKFTFTDVFNYGKIQHGGLMKTHLGSWIKSTGLTMKLNAFKYYERWDFNNLTMRAVSVVLGDQKGFHPNMLSDVKYTPGINKMTKMPSMILEVLKEVHNFRFNYTIAGHWTGPTARNSAKAVTNTIYWGEQDISSTGARMFPNWYQWVDIFFPPLTTLETKFYYRIPSKGIGEYENRFLAPMSPVVWYCIAGAGATCAVVLAVAAGLEHRETPGVYALFSVLAATCQQAYEDGVNALEGKISSQGRRLTLLVIGLTSMVLYNYYTSSVVSWLLSAPVPTIDTIDGLMRSDLELVFEDIGYTKSWLEYPGFFYYNGVKDVKEDELRECKVKQSKRTIPLLRSVEEGIELVRKGGYAYHTEPYTASQVIGRSFDEQEICELGAVQMIRPALVYIYAPKRSPYKQFFVWSLMRMSERGHVSACSGRVAMRVATCSGHTPRALALGQAAPAFLLQAILTLLSLAILVIEILCHRFRHRNDRS